MFAWVLFHHNYILLMNSSHFKAITHSLNIKMTDFFCKLFKVNNAICIFCKIINMSPPSLMLLKITFEPNLKFSP